MSCHFVSLGLHTKPSVLTGAQNGVTIGLVNNNPYPLTFYFVRGWFSNAFTGSVLANFTQRGYHMQVAPFTLQSVSLKPGSSWFFVFCCVAHVAYCCVV